MNWLNSDLVGYIAATLTTSAFIPQALMTWKNKRAEGVSLSMYVILITGVILWLTYGIMLSAWPVIIANVITLFLTIFILLMKIVYK
ncbi:SemiSWEET transporter [Undibacterium luofuense]|uniref:SemiSWEET transporter n=1 Tax=Undibacterium luofuense TaxID=2828733 RepID=A0A941DJI1_9BURK|nr:SemiSWEET transporter [Undibacterium luofuense]MBR7781184.1 SemiSWEET transporter [Undibacterium luofuense]